MESLGERLAEHAAHLDAAMHRFLADLRTFDDGQGWALQSAQTCAHWLAWRLGMDRGTAREHLRVAHRLAELPLVDDALRRGAISYSKVRAITRVAMPATEAVLVGMAERMTANQLETTCRKLRTTQRQPEDPNESAERRFLSRRDCDDGMTQITAILRPDEAARLFSVLDAIAAERTREQQACPDVSAETRSSSDRTAEQGHSSSDNAHSQSDRTRAQRGHDASAETGSSCDRTGEQGHSGSENAHSQSDRARAQRGHDASAETGSSCDRTGAQQGHDASAETRSSSDRTGEQGHSSSDNAHSQSDRNRAQRGHDASAETRSQSDRTRAQQGHVSAETRSPPDRKEPTRKIRGHRFDRCDALMELAERYARGGQPDRAAIDLVVTVSAAALAGDPATPLDRVGVTADGTCLPLSTIRRLACDSGVVIVAEDDDGTPLSVGRKHRTVTGRLKRALTRRDPHCQFPGCTNSVFLEAHHIEHWIDGGTTDLKNVLHLCSHHHDLLHDHRFTVKAGKPPRFFDDLGRAIEHVPARPRPASLGWPAIRAANANLAIREDTNMCRWDGDDADYEAAIAELCRLEDQACEPDEWSREFGVSAETPPQPPTPRTDDD